MLKFFNSSLLEGRQSVQRQQDLSNEEAFNYVSKMGRGGPFFFGLDNILLCLSLG